MQGNGFRILLVSVLLCGGPLNQARAHIYECQRSDGSRHYTNQRRADEQCRVFIRASKSKATAKRQSSRSAAASGTQQRPSYRFPSGWEHYQDYTRKAAVLYKLPEAFLRAVMKVESGYNPNVVSDKGAMGLMQLMPQTAASMGVRDPFDPAQNIYGGARFLRILANKFQGDIVLTTAAYNAGPQAVERHLGIPPYEETQRYVRRVLELYYKWKLSPSSQ